MSKEEINMIYVLAVFVPPLVAWMRGGPIKALINIGLTFLFWFPAVFHAIYIVREHDRLEAERAARRKYESDLREQEQQMREYDEEYGDDDD
jgi:uncharacterized membrane protein YqaE (UPF0057 family)